MKKYFTPKEIRRAEAEIIYHTQFYDKKHGKLRRWLIVKLLEFQLKLKK